MRLYFIRHGQTDWNLAGKIQGSSDIELNETGIAQAKELSRKLSEENYSIARIYSSKQKRAYQTASIISRTLGCELTPIDGLEEVRLGNWEGLSWQEVKSAYPSEYDAWYHDRRYYKSHQGESYQELLERVLPAVHHIISENTKDVAIITHNAVIMCLQCYLTHTPFHRMIDFKAGNTSIITLDSKLFTQDAFQNMCTINSPLSTT